MNRLDQLQLIADLRDQGLLGPSIWGTEGPEFKSRQPDRKPSDSLDWEVLLAALRVSP